MALAIAGELSAANPTDAGWAVFAAAVLLRERRFSEAIERYGDVLKRYGENQRAYQGRGVAYLCRRDYQRAIDDFSRSIELMLRQEGRHAPDWLYYARATPLWITEQYAEAAADYARFAEGQGFSAFADARRYLVLCDQASALEKSGQLAEAAAVRAEAQRGLATARRAAPPGSWINKILSCLAGDLSPEQLVASADASNAEAVCESYYYAGEVCRLAGRTEAACEWFRKCVQTDLLFDVDTYPVQAMNEYHLAAWRLEQLSGGVGSSGGGAGAADHDTPP